MYTKIVTIAIQKCRKKKESILKYNHGEKSLKIPFIIYADMESLHEKINTCYKNPKKLSTVKINSHTASGYSLFSHCSFNTRKYKLNYYSGKDCIKSVLKRPKKTCNKNK